MKGTRPLDNHEIRNLGLEGSKFPVAVYTDAFSQFS